MQALATTTQAAEARGEIAVFLLIGQSNMVGAARAYQIKKPLPSPREDILFSYKIPRMPHKPDHEDIVSPGFVALDTYHAPFIDNNEPRWGPEITLGSTLKDDYFPSQPIALIKFAQGSTNLYRDWKATATKGAQLYPRSLEYLQEQMESLRCMGYSPQLKGVFWFQGEGDSNAKTFGATAAQAYRANLNELIAAYRRDLDAPQMPFVLARINPTRPPFDHAAIIRQAIVDIAEANPRIQWVDTDDLKFPDRLHVDGNGQFIVGQRFADAWAELTK
jgi:hypothetical protein